MLKMLRVVEIAWIVMAVLSVIQATSMWQQPGNEKWYFLGFSLFAVFMFFFRRRYRLRYEQRQADKEREQEKVGN
jgi:membrane protein implicated in regulation of membrane protease activity